MAGGGERVAAERQVLADDDPAERVGAPDERGLRDAPASGHHTRPLDCRPVPAELGRGPDAARPPHRDDAHPRGMLHRQTGHPGGDAGRPRGSCSAGPGGREPGDGAALGGTQRQPAAGQGPGHKKVFAVVGARPPRAHSLRPRPVALPHRHPGLPQTVQLTLTQTTNLLIVFTFTCML